MARFDRKLLFQFAHPFQQFRQLLQGNDLPLRLPVRLGRASEPFFAIRDIVHDAGLSGYRNPVADFQVTRDAALSAKYHVIPYLSAAGDACLGNDKTVISENDVVADLN